jgi:hypothetical protein
VSASTPLDFYLQGTRGAYAAVAASVDAWQPVAVTCPSCGTRYIGAVERRDSAHDAAQVRAYPDVAAQVLLASRYLDGECPDHGVRVRVRPFSVVA